jgi:hypothetical protein
VTVDREMLKQELAQAESGIALTERLIARQNAIVRDLDQGSHDTADAKLLLAAFERALKIKIAVRERLRGDLDQS